MLPHRIEKERKAGREFEPRPKHSFTVSMGIPKHETLAISPPSCCWGSHIRGKNGPLSGGAGSAGRDATSECKGLSETGSDEFVQLVAVQGNENTFNILWLEVFVPVLCVNVPNKDTTKCPSSRTTWVSMHSWCSFQKPWTTEGPAQNTWKSRVAEATFEDMEYRIETWTLSGLHETCKLGSWLDDGNLAIFFWAVGEMVWQDLLVGIREMGL